MNIIWTTSDTTIGILFVSAFLFLFITNFIVKNLRIKIPDWALILWGMIGSWVIASLLYLGVLR